MSSAKATFTTAEAARIFGKSQSVFKVWRQRGICDLGAPGKVWAFSWIDMMKIGAAFSLNGYGIDLKTAFQILDHHRLQGLFAARMTENEHQALYLYYTFDPLAPGRDRSWNIMGRLDDRIGFHDPRDYETPTEAMLKVDMRHVADRWLSTIQRGLDADIEGIAE